MKRQAIYNNVVLIDEFGATIDGIFQIEKTIDINNLAHFNQAETT